MWAVFGKSRGVGGSYEKSLPWGGYGYFLEPHNRVNTVAPLSPNSDKNGNSLKITTNSTIQVMRIKEVITKDKMSIFIQILLTSSI